MTNKLPYATKSIEVQGVTLVVPADVPSNARCDVLVALYSEHVKPLTAGGHWKGPCFAEVASDIAADVAEAMLHMGSIVDDRQELAGGLVRLYSEGYWAHGF